MDIKKASSYILLTFIFALSFVIVFASIHWFSGKVAGILKSNSGFLQANLKAPFDDAKASVNQDLAVSQDLLPLRDWQVKDLEIEATSAMSVEIGKDTKKVLFKKSESERLPIASLTKLMTALVVLDNYDLSKKITIDESIMAQEGDQGDLKLGQVLTVKDLLYITLIESSNRAAYAILTVVGQDKFIELMNNRAELLGLENTHFEDATGLSEKSYSTVENLVRLSEYLFKRYPLFGEIINLKEYDLYLSDGSFHHKLINTNQLLGENKVIGGKTGFTKIANGCFMVIQESSKTGNYIISIILGSQDRSSEMKNLIDWIGVAYKW